MTATVGPRLDDRFPQHHGEACWKTEQIMYFTNKQQQPQQYIYNAINLIYPSEFDGIMKSRL